jgi:hypothetical protein
MDTLSQQGISISIDGDNKLAQRLKTKLKAEIEKFEREQAQAHADHDKYLAVAREKIDHITCSRHRTATSGWTQDQLSDQALQDASRYLAGGVSDDELRRIFGPTSDSRYAAQIGRNRALYAALQRMYLDRGLDRQRR